MKIVKSSKKMVLDYYPFGLKHRGYNDVVSANVNSVASKFTFNGKEWDESLNLNTFDLGARQMDPAIGRFMVIDPMADFVNYQSPYAVADNNPIRNIDAYGLGSRPPWWLRWLVGGEGRNCSCKRREGVIGFIGRKIGDIFKPKPNKRKKNKRKKKKRSSSSTSSTTSSNDNTNDTRSPVSPIPTISAGLVDLGGEFEFGVPEIRIPAPVPEIPKFDGTPITSPIGFDRQVLFKSNSDKFKDDDNTEKILLDLIKTLKEYPQLKVLILGNTSSAVGSTKKNLSDSAKLNGTDTTIGGLQLARARAVERFLISRGVNWRQILIGNGEARTSGESGRTTRFILKN